MFDFILLYIKKYINIFAVTETTIKKMYEHLILFWDIHIHYYYYYLKKLAMQGREREIDTLSVRRP